MDVVFMGTPYIACNILQQIEKYISLVGVYTRPDKPSGRGNTLKYSEVKEYALQKGYPLFQPKTLHTEEAEEQLRNLAPDILIIVAYGAILPQAILDIPTFGAVNVHGSLLPAYRGAGPIQRALWNGEKVTGATIMQLDAGMDTGDILLTSSFPIHRTDTTYSLMHTMAEYGGRALLRTLSYFMARSENPTADRTAIHATVQQSALYNVTQNDTIEDYVLKPKKQDNTYATEAKKITKDDEVLVWKTARAVHNRIQALTSGTAPVAVTTLHREGAKPLRVKICLGDYCLDEGINVGASIVPQAKAGHIIGLRNDVLYVQCTDGVYIISSLRPENKKTLTAKEFYAGYIQGKDAFFV